MRRLYIIMYITTRIKIESVSGISPFFAKLPECPYRDVNISNQSILVCTELSLMGLYVIKFCTDIHDPQRILPKDYFAPSDSQVCGSQTMNINDFCDALAHFSTSCQFIFFGPNWIFSATVKNVQFLHINMLTLSLRQVHMVTFAFAELLWR